jgi:PAS domain S-box-containing protein
MGMSEKSELEELKRKIIGLENQVAAQNQTAERLRRFVKYANDSFFLHDYNGRILDVNENACQSLGYSSAELLNLSMADIEQDFALENHQEQWRKMMPGAATTLEGVHRCKDGTTFPVEIRLSLFEKGHEKFMLGIVRDISERLKAEEAINESECKYRMLFEHGGFATSVSDLETGEIIAYNRKVYEYLGYTREEFQKIKSCDIQRHKDPAELSKELAQIVEKGSEVIEIKHKTKDGRLRDILMSRVPVRIHGRFCVQHIYFDITEWKKLNAELKSNEAKLEENNQNLVEMNAALKVLLKKGDEDKAELQEGVHLRINQLILPYLEKLKRCSGGPKQCALFDILESNLNDIVSPYPYGINSKNLNLTPMEIKIANLIQQGNSSKEIAGIFNLSSRTVDVHRANIRKKLGLRSKKNNLESFLNTL